MGKDKTTSNQSTSYTATPEERQLEQMQLQRAQNNQGNQQSLDNNLFNTINTILQGGNLPSSLQGLYGINSDQTQEMVNSSLKDIYPQFQNAGILDSGTAAQISSQTAGGIRNQNAQFNVSALQNLLNQALGGGSNLQSNTNQGNQILGNQLAGLRTSNTSGSTYSMNPFLKSFQTAAGEGVGKFVGGLPGQVVSGGFGGNTGAIGQLGSSGAGFNAGLSRVFPSWTI